MARLFASASSQRIDLASGLPDWTSGQLSVGCWFRLTTAPPGFGVFSFFSKGPATGTGRNFDLQYRDIFGTSICPNWHTTSGTAVEYYYTATLSNATWYHVVAAVDWSATPDTVAVYVNGAAVTVTNNGNTNAPPVVAGTQQTRLGADHAGAPPTTGLLNGSLAEVFVTPTFLTANQAAALARGQPPTALGVPLDGYWPLWGTHSPEIDLVPGGHAGTVTGATAADHAPVGLFSRRFWGPALPAVPAAGPPPPPTAYAAPVVMHPVYRPRG